MQTTKPIDSIEWRHKMLSSAKMSAMAVLLAGLVFAAGCETSAQSGTLIGAGAGALAGQAIGRNTTGTLIGAGVGAAGGYIVGNEMDKKKAKESEVTAPRQSSNYSSGNNSSSNGAAAVTTPSNTSSYSSAGTSSGEVATVSIKNTNGSMTPVTLHKQGTDWVGPKGEHYDHLPTEAELRPIYGI
jgi:hypothetical protein